VLYNQGANTKIKTGDKMRQTRFPKTGDVISWYRSPGELYCSTVVNDKPNLINPNTPFRDVQALSQINVPLGGATYIPTEPIVVNSPSLGGLHVLFLRAGDAEILSELRDDNTDEDG
jgi:hypothetical protein